MIEWPPDIGTQSYSLSNSMFLEARTRFRRPRSPTDVRSGKELLHSHPFGRSCSGQCTILDWDSRSESLLVESSHSSGS